MPTATSTDGTTIAYDRSGEGPALVLVDGATQTRWAGSKPQLVELLVHDFRVYSTS